MITQQALEKYLWGAATLLRGLIDAGDYKQSGNWQGALMAEKAMNKGHKNSNQQDQSSH